MSPRESSRSFGVWLSGLVEGVAIALESIKSNRVRAALTILGVAVGVFVVVVISAAIHGINASVAKDFESAGPSTFFLSRYPITFEACDGTDDTCKWRHNPRLSYLDNKAVAELSSVRASGARIFMGKEVRYKDRVLPNTQVIGYTSNWTIIDGGGDLYPGRSFTDAEETNGEHVVV
ncbi:MAG: ABC transporter permease, partial [Gemmatimonadaceae bacterium]